MRLAALGFSMRARRRTLVCGERKVRRAVEAWRLELELDATVAEQLEPVVTDRGPRAIAKELLESVAQARKPKPSRGDYAYFFTEAMCTSSSCSGFTAAGAPVIRSLPR
jgi:hypothetical protein